MKNETTQTTETPMADDRVLATGVFIIQGNKITFQRANYIEDDIMLTRLMKIRGALWT